MPVARGIMQMDRINVWPTVTTFSVTPASPTTCGTAITCSVTVTNSAANVPPLGTVRMIDGNNNAILATGTLAAAGVNYSTATLYPSITNGSIALTAKFIGQVGGTDLAHQFKPSLSAPISYNVNLISANTSISSPNPDAYFCYHAALPVTAYVSNSGSPITSGNVTFVLWANAASSTTLGTSVLDGTGHASFSVPANTTVPPNVYYLEAIFDGTGCFTPSSSGSGTSGTPVFSSYNDTTSTTVSSAGGSSFCIANPSTFNITVSPTHLIAPSIGTISVTAVQILGGGPGTPFALGSGTPTNGLLSLVVPANTFPTPASYNVTAVYTGDGYCYQSSTSTAITVNPTYISTAISVTGPNNFCYAQDSVFTVNVTSSNGSSLSGSLKIYAGSTLVSTTPFTGSSGSYYYPHIPAYTFSAGSSYVQAQFISDGTNCLANSTSSNYPVTIQGIVSPSVSLALDHNSGNYTDTLILTGTINRNGGVSGLGSTIYWEYYDPSSVFHSIGPITLVDTGGILHPTYTFTGLPNGAGTYTFYMYYNGNNCYAGETTSASSAQQFTAFAPLH
jgi:hypothetical protein